MHSQWLYTWLGERVHWITGDVHRGWCPSLFSVSGRFLTLFHFCFTFNIQIVFWVKKLSIGDYLVLLVDFLPLSSLITTSLQTRNFCLMREICQFDICESSFPIALCGSGSFISPHDPMLTMLVLILWRCTPMALTVVHAVNVDWRAQTCSLRYLGEIII